MVENLTKEYAREEIRQIVRTHLKYFPLFDEQHDVNVCDIGEGKIWIGYKSSKHWTREGTTHFDINLEGKTCFLLHIEIIKSERGKGHGKTLYGIIENFAKELGCHDIRLNPSGHTPSGKTRKEYMMKLGYHEVGDIVEKML